MRILDGDSPEPGLNDRFDLHSQPIDPLPLGHIMAVTAVGGRSLEAVGHAVNLALAVLLHSPHVEPPFEVVRQIALEFRIQLLDANGIVLASIQVFTPEHVVRRGGLYCRRGFRLTPARQGIVTQAMNEAVVVDIRRNTWTVKIQTPLVGLAFRTRQRKVQRADAVAEQAVYIEERRGRLQSKPLADSGQRAVRGHSPPTEPCGQNPRLRHGLVCQVRIVDPVRPGPGPVGIADLIRIAIVPARGRRCHGVRLRRLRGENLHARRANHDRHGEYVKMIESHSSFL